MMRQGVILLSAIGIAAAPLRSSMAGDKEWATAGKIMVGLAALAIVSEAVADDHAVCVTSAAPRRIIHVHAPRRVWIEGRYVEVVQKIWVPGYFEEVWVPPVRSQVQRARPFGGMRHESIVRPGFFRKVWRPGQYVQRRERRWMPGYWKEI